MTVQEILRLIDAGFTADEVRAMGAAPVEPAPEPAAAPTAAPEPVPAAPAPEPAAAPAQTQEPEQQAAAPSWFDDFVKRNNEEMAQLQRALQVQNVRRAEPPPSGKTPEQLMAEAYHAIVD